MHPVVHICTFLGDQVQRRASGPPPPFPNLEGADEAYINPLEKPTGPISPYAVVVLSFAEAETRSAIRAL